MSEAKKLLKQLSAQKTSSTAVSPPVNQSSSSGDWTPLPARPRAEVILPDSMRRQPRRTWLRYAPWVFGFVVIGELVGLKPMHFIATPFRAFYTEMANVGVYSAEQQALAQARAQAAMAEELAKAQAAGEIEASRARSKGICGILGEFNPVCTGLVDSWHNQQKQSLQN